MKVTALLTGRGNNTLKDKNLLEVCQKPVLYYPAKAAALSRKINDYYCSSDDKRILDEAEALGYKRILRPKELGTPTAQHADVIRHALDEIKGAEIIPDILVVLLANNVTVKTEWIDKAIAMMQEDMTISAVVPVYEDNDHHPFRAKRSDKSGRLYMFYEVEGELSTNRQELPKCFFLSHNFWVLNVKLMIDSDYQGQQPWGFMGENIAYFEIDTSIDIHKKTDLYLASEWIKENWRE